MSSFALENLQRLTELVLVAFGVAAVVLLLLEVVYLAVVAIYLAVGSRRTPSGSGF